MVITFTIPEKWLQALLPNYSSIRGNEALLRPAIKELVIRGIRGNVSPSTNQDEEQQPKVRVNLSFPEPDSGLLRSAAATSGASPSLYVKLMLGAMSTNAAAFVANASNDDLRLSKLISALSDRYPSIRSRPEQLRMYSNLRDCMQRGMIGLIEASTGVGKTRAMLCAASDWVNERNSSVVIAAPTIALLRQFSSEWALQDSVSPMPDLRLVFGKREFVSSHDLDQFLIAPAGKVWNTEAVRKWIKSGGASPFVENGVQSRWLCSALELHAPGFPIDEVRLDEVALESDPGLLAYRSQFASRPGEAQIIVCSHAMLAQHMRMRLIAAGRDEDFQAIGKEIEGVFASMRAEKSHGGKPSAANVDSLRSLYVMQRDVFSEVEGGLLPPFRAILVDEAHKLEEQFSNALTEYLSLNSIQRTVQEFRDAGGRLPVGTADVIQNCVADISRCGAEAGRDILNLSASFAQAQRIKTSLAQLSAAIDLIPMPKKSENAEKLMAAVKLRRARALARIACSYGDVRSYVRFSPVRAYPQLYIGRSNVTNVLSLLWGSVDAGAAVSATLYLSTGAGESSAFYQKILLAIPDDRVAEYLPIEASWIFEPVKALYVPSPESSAKLRPPSRSDKLSEHKHAVAEAQWLGNLSDVLANIHRKSAGGTLVLMTAYAHIKEMCKLLEAAHPRIVLVVADGDTPVIKQKEQFLSLRASGKKPLWLSVGGAWTGLDVGGHDPWKAQFGEALDAADDNVLTTLVIPRLPFGTNNTITHQWRKNQRPGVQWELFETAFHFKQGLGRLIRRIGLPLNREIWVLDGRLNDPGFSNVVPLFRKIMERYNLLQIDAL